MGEIKNTVIALTQYQEIGMIFDIEIDKSVIHMIEILKKIENHDLIYLENLIECKTEQKINNRVQRKGKDKKDVLDIFQLGKIYYKSSTNIIITDEEQQMLEEYLLDSKQTVIRNILALSGIEQYDLLNNLSLNKLTAKQLCFLGAALLNIKIMGKDKTDQKQNLLIHLRKVYENKRMKEIYQSV